MVKSRVGFGAYLWRIAPGIVQRGGLNSMQFKVLLEKHGLLKLFILSIHFERVLLFITVAITGMVPNPPS